MGFGDLAEPRAYRPPFDQATAETPRRALEEAREPGGGVKMRPPFEFDSPGQATRDRGRRNEPPLSRRRLVRRHPGRIAGEVPVAGSDAANARKRQPERACPTVEALVPCRSLPGACSAGRSDGSPPNAPALPHSRDLVHRRRRGNGALRPRRYTSGPPGTLGSRAFRSVGPKFQRLEVPRKASSVELTPLAHSEKPVQFRDVVLNGTLPLFLRGVTSVA